ncbi:MAG: PfkB family carbohydrate kinase, partial [Pseudomonadota bacterium]
MPRCWVIGDAAVDLIPEGDHYLKCPGGTGANVAVALSRLGIDCAFVAKLGDDPPGAFIIETLERENVNAQHVSFSERHKTSLIIVSIDDSGEREFTFMVNPSADSQLENSDIPTFEQNDWLCVSAFVLARQSSRESTFLAIQQAKKAGSFVCVDANMRIDMWDDGSLMIPRTLEALKLADIAKMSGDELQVLTNTTSIEDGLEEARQWPAKIKVITLAEKGAVVLTEKSELYVEGYDVPVVDMTGAGDAFFAAFVSNLMPFDNWT